MSWAEDTKLRLRVFCLIAMFACPAFLVWSAGETRQQIASNSWPSVEGEVLYITAKDWWDDDSNTTKYYGRVMYTYMVDGQEFTTDLTDLGPGMKRIDRETALEDVSEYRPGMKVMVYYDPDDPGVGVIKKGIPGMHLVLLVILCVGTVICTITSFFTIRAWTWGRRSIESSPNQANHDAVADAQQ